MAYISEEEINKIRNSTNIVDIVSDYIPLSKSGNDYVCVCPFHDDHSPSMHVSPKLNIFKCFVCNTGGNVFSFVQKFENVSYLEAVKIVASKTGINFNYNVDNTFNNKYKKEFDLMNISLAFYQNNIATQSGIEAKKYLSSRGIDDNIIKEFKIGLSLDNNQLKEYFDNKGNDLELGYKLGLLNKDGINYYDMFTNRIMIPIFDMQGNLAGYTARAYLKEAKNKYINSKETDIYKKSNILFNYYNARDYARLEKEIIIVEGNMDAIMLSVNNIKNVVALMGVVISKNQIDALKKLNSRVVLMLDSDNAGDLATIKVGEELYNSGLNLHVVRLSGAKDPDEYIRKFGVDKLKDNIKHAKKYLDFKLETLKSDKDLNNIEELTEYIKQVIDSLKDASDLEREVAIGKICKEYNIEPEIIRRELPKKEINTIKIEKPITVKKNSKYELASKQLVYALLLDKKYYQLYLKKLGYLLNKVERDTINLIGEYIDINNNIDISGFLDFVIKYDDVYKYVNDVFSNFNQENIAENEFYDILSTVSKCIDEEEIKLIKEKIKNEQDISKKIELIERLTELKKGCGNNEGD